MTTVSEKERAVALMRAARRAACAHWTQADYDRNFRETVARPLEAKGHVHHETAAFLDWLRAERAGRINYNAQDFERFLGNVTDGKHFRARTRLAMSREYFTSEPFLAAQDWADWQNTPGVLRMFAGAFAHELRRDNIPVICTEAGAFHVCLRHARYKELTRSEVQTFVFAGCRVADKLDMPVEWGGGEVWQLPHVGPPPEPRPELIQRFTLAGLRRRYPAKSRQSA